MMLHYYSTIYHLHLNYNTESLTQLTPTPEAYPTLLRLHFLTVQAASHTQMAGASVWRLLVCVWRSGSRHPDDSQDALQCLGWAACLQPGQAGSGKSFEGSESSLGCGWGSSPEQEVSTESILAHCPTQPWEMGPGDPGAKEWTLDSTG